MKNDSKEIVVLLVLLVVFILGLMVAGEWLYLLQWFISCGMGFGIIMLVRFFVSKFWKNGSNK